MKKTRIPNKLNYKPQAHAKVSAENKEKNDCGLKYFVVKGSTLEACRGTMTPGIQPIFTTRIVHNIKVLVLHKLVCVKRVLAVVTETSVKNLRLAGSSGGVGRFTPSLGC